MVLAMPCGFVKVKGFSGRCAKIIKALQAADERQGPQIKAYLFQLQWRDPCILPRGFVTNVHLSNVCSARFVKLLLFNSAFPGFFLHQKTCLSFL